jgi:cyclopropane fatty-acyl-phospholipid synthase-like methyltransferase
MILSTGFTEFLEDEQVVRFFTIVRGQLREDGLLFTSAMLPHRISDYLLRKLAEIHTHYRSAAHITSLLDAAGFARCETYQDSTRLQTIVLARP